MLQMFDRVRTDWVFLIAGMGEVWRTSIHLWQCTLIEGKRMLLLFSRGIERNQGNMCIERDRIDNEK